jgi:Site-specific recombinase XerD
MMHNRSCEPERAVFDYDAMSDLIEEYLQVLRSAEKSPATIRDRGRCLRRLHADLPFGIGAACREQLQAWLDYEQWSVKTKLVYRSHISAFFQWLVLEGVLLEDPTARLVRPRMPRGLPHPATDEQLALALTAPEPLRTAVVLANWAGLRRAEAAGADREDITEELVIVRRGKGGDAGTVPTHPSLWGYVRHRPAGALIVDAHGRRLSPERLGALAHRWFAANGYPEHFGLHWFRHRYATLIQRLYRDIRVTQECMRHRSVSSTQIYTLVSDAQRAEAVRKLPGIEETGPAGPRPGLA